MVCSTQNVFGIQQKSTKLPQKSRNPPYLDTGIWTLYLKTKRRDKKKTSIQTEKRHTVFVCTPRPTQRSLLLFSFTYSQTRMKVQVGTFALVLSHLDHNRYRTASSQKGGVCRKAKLCIDATQRQYCLDNNCCTVKIVSVHKGEQEVQQENSSGMGSDAKGFGEKNMFGWFFFVLLWVYVLCFLF